jgi:pyridoxal phosphate enzyme (YggS family)
MSLKSNIQQIEEKLKLFDTHLIIVTKTKPISLLMEVYDLGYRVFGENRVQELVEKHENMPKDIVWHLIGHLQTNKVKYIAPFVSLIHSVDSFKLLEEINKQALKNNRIIDCLLQIYIAKEESKFGLSEAETLEILNDINLAKSTNIKIVGLMGMASNTADNAIVEKEFATLKHFFEEIKTISRPNVNLTQLSMGMSNDFELAAKIGSTMVRVGSAVFK